jgi:hypothetical protein
VAHVMMMHPMTVYRIVLVIGAGLQLKMNAVNAVVMVLPMVLVTVMITLKTVLVFVVVMQLLMNAVNVVVMAIAVVKQAM